MASKFLTVALLAAAPILARTDLEGCTTYDTVISDANGMYASRIWYVPDTGELCDFLDCGGGRAPPKTTVPGCPAYEGTETYSPLFINPKTLGGAAAEETGSSASATSSDEDDETRSATITQAPTTETKASVASTAAETETESEDMSESKTQSKDTKTITTLTTHATASSGAESGSDFPSGAGSNSSASNAAATPASTAVSTAGAAMPTAGAFLALAGAAMYAGML
ncbi:uncharacterized protein FTOL_05563 [Fusarium torulosum]|uniref:Siderophore biosynthesis enzyme n=1 Tax=Fusarium torulosum TaxID=33205 RepID=A0AAE8M7S3_9HYPO|nr:uncharacterized protein FTOL_05563 [Fusarium torulosum]